MSLVPGSLVGGRKPGQVRGGRQQVARLRGEHEWEELWGRLLEQTDRFGLTSVQLDVNHPALREDFSASWTRGGVRPDPQKLLRADLPLVGGHSPAGWLRVTAEHTGDRAADRLAELMATLAEFEKELIDLLETVLPTARAAAARPPVHGPVQADSPGASDRRAELTAA